MKFKLWIFITLALVLTIGIGVVQYTTDFMGLADKEQKTGTLQASWPFNRANDRELVGAADNVFIGKVIQKIGNKNYDRIPQMQYDVEVIENIKGKIDKNIIVNQEGGVLDNTLLKHEGDTFIEPGKIYLFVTGFEKSENWHTLIPKFGNLLIDEENTDKNKEKLKERFKKAHKEEIKMK